MLPFSFIEAETSQQALDAVTANPGAAFFAGGTTLIDLMKLDILQPTELVSINRLALSSIQANGDGVAIGANVRNSDLAHHPVIRENFPVLSEAILAGASGQLRNMATTGGNVMQRTRCAYFRNVNSKCNKRQEGSGCDALTGYNRSHAILGTSDSCIATHPSDMCVALIVLDAVIETQQQDGKRRRIPIAEFYVLPGDTPKRETVLLPNELITHVHIAYSRAGRNSHYLKVRDRASYEFALSSAAVALETERGTIKEVRVGLGGVATVPWRSHEAEQTLKNKSLVRESFVAAAEAALAKAKPRNHNAFKVHLAKRTLVLAFEELLRREKRNGE